MFFCNYKVLRKEQDSDHNVENNIFNFAGDPQATGTATLLVTVTDNNDNAPALREEYNFQVNKKKEI